MSKKESNSTSEFLDYVYSLNEGKTLQDAFRQSLENIDAIDIALFNKIGTKTYDDGKWTIHTILQHLIDWERIWCFRALLFARNEGNTPVAHDQEVMAKNAHPEQRPIEELVIELRTVRQSTIMLYNSFTMELLDKECSFYEYKMPLSAIGFTITAHQIHHLNVIKERYFPLV